MAYCKECGAKLDENAKFCQNCGKQLEKNEKLFDIEETNTSLGKSNNPICPYCKSSKVNVQMISETKPRGCLTVIFYIFLSIITCGLFVIILLLAKGPKTKHKSVFVCQNCGKTFNIQATNSKVTTGQAILIAIVILVFLVVIALGIYGIKDEPISDVAKTYYLGNTIEFKDFSVIVEKCQIKYENEHIDDYYVISEPEWIAITFTYINTSNEEKSLRKYNTRIINSKGEIIEPSSIYYNIWNVEYLDNTKLLPNGSKTGFIQFSNTVKDKAEDLTLQISTSSLFEKENTYNIKLYSEQ